MKNIKTLNNIEIKERYEKITYLTKEIVFLEFVLILSIPVAFAYQEYSLTYDGNGNLITGDGKYRVYNEFNQLVEVYSGNDTSGEELEFYLWHPTEDRILVKKVLNVSVFPDEVVVYVNDNFDKSYTNLGGDPFINETYYVYDDYGLVGEEIYNTTFRGVDDQPVYPATFLQKIFYHSDHLGSTTVITNSSGGVVEKTFYDPYGEIIIGGEKSRYDYEGKEFSSVTGDYDFNFRKYDPELGIFTQPDAVLVNVYDPQQLNRYSFERRNPYGYVDRDGKAISHALSILAVGHISGTVAGTYYLAKSVITNERPTLKGYYTYYGVGFFSGGISAGAVILGTSTGGLIGGGLVASGLFTSGINSQAFVNAATGRPIGENTLSTGFRNLITYKLSGFLPESKTGSSQFFLNSIYENIFDQVTGSIYDFFTGSNNQPSSQQINYAKQSTTSLDGGRGDSSNIILLNNPGDSSSNGGGSSGRGLRNSFNNVVNSVKKFFGGLF